MKRRESTLNLDSNHLCIKLPTFSLLFTALKNHVLAVHEKLKPYLCDICGYAASAKANLVSSFSSKYSHFGTDICTVDVRIPDVRISNFWSVLRL